MSYLSIRNKDRSDDLREAQAETFWKSLEAIQVKRETEELGKKIARFFPRTDAGNDAYLAWVNAGPDDNAAFLDYCRAEWARIVSEIEFGHKLAGLRFIVAQPAQSVSTFRQ